MASAGRHVGRRICQTGRLFNANLKEPWRLGYSRLSSAVCQEHAAALSGSTEEIIIPRKKTWSKEAVLRALASTVDRDATASHYMFQDDSYLTPRTSGEFKLYSLSQESGRNAAKYFINTYPKFFQKDFAEPHVPCLMPETVELQMEEVSEAALLERIKLRKVKAAVDMYDQLLQAGSPVSLELTNELLDLICLYGDRDPVREDSPEQRTEVVEEEADDGRRRKGGPRRASDLLRIVWRENNNAERIFNLMSERNSRSYAALIRGMVKFGAYGKAFGVYTDLLNSRLTADVHTFNALIGAVVEVKDKHSEKWEQVLELLKQMVEQKVKPNLLTFNSVLKVLKRCGSLGKAQAFPTLTEMKALGIASSGQGHSEILQEVLNETEGKSFTTRDPDDVLFFPSAMRACLDTRDMEQAYRVHRLLEVGDNWKLLGDSYHQSVYYGRFFNLLCMMEHVDVVLKWYKQLIPSLYYPNSQGMRDLLQALDTDNRLDLIPHIWKDIRRLGQDNKAELLEEMLALMAREKQSPEVQRAFADCALEVKTLYTQSDRVKAPLPWSAGSLSSITAVLLAAERTAEAWEMLKLFKENNRVPSEDLVEGFLDCMKVNLDAQRAVELLQISSSFCLHVTPKLTERVKQEFELTEEQRNILSELESSSGTAD